MLPYLCCYLAISLIWSHMASRMQHIVHPEADPSMNVITYWTNFILAPFVLLLVLVVPYLRRELKQSLCQN